MPKLLAMLALFAVSVCAQPNLSGAWEWNNPQKSENTPDWIRVKIDQQGGNFEITMRAFNRGEIDQNSNRYAVGQETKGQMHGAPMTSRAEWDGSTLVVHSVAVLMGKELRLTDRYNVSSDGNVLHFSEKHQYGAEPEGETVRSLERRPGNTWEPDAPPKPAEEVYKNIQIMKGVPAPRLRAAMTNLTKWLGVECAHCHVMGQFESDDKPAKKTARSMFMMVRQINQQNSFPQGNSVTCWTCHRGSAKPQNLPPQ